MVFIFPDERCLHFRTNGAYISGHSKRRLCSKTFQTVRLYLHTLQTVLISRTCQTVIIYSDVPNDHYISGHAKRPLHLLTFQTVLISPDIPDIVYIFGYFKRSLYIRTFQTVLIFLDRVVTLRLSPNQAHRESGLLNVRLLVQDTKLIVPVDQLHPGKVSLLHRRLIHRLKPQHLPLEGIDNTVLLLYFDNLLFHHYRYIEDFGFGREREVGSGWG